MKKSIFSHSRISFSKHLQLLLGLFIVLLLYLQFPIASDTVVETHFFATIQVDDCDSDDMDTSTLHYVGFNYVEVQRNIYYYVKSSNVYILARQRAPPSFS